MAEAARSLFAVLFPADCRLCGAPLTTISRLPVCPECLESIRPIEEPVCALCGERLWSEAAAQANELCGMCRRAQPFFDKAIAFGSYDGGLRGLIHLLKYDQVRPAAAVLGRMLAGKIEELRPQFGPEPPLVAPVPLHRSRMWQRGFNQAEEIARRALKQVKGLKLEPLLMSRRRATESQTGLTRHQRRANIRGAFRVRRPKAVAGCDVILVDDVFTTGTTAGECARVLRRAGARRVFVVTVARVLRPRPQLASQYAGSQEEVAIA